jgi:hypothetical protein
MCFRNTMPPWWPGPLTPWPLMRSGVELTKVHPHTVWSLEVVRKKNFNAIDLWKRPQWPWPLTQWHLRWYGRYSSSRYKHMWNKKALDEWFSMLWPKLIMPIWGHGDFDLWTPWPLMGSGGRAHQGAYTCEVWRL